MKDELENHGVELTLPMVTRSPLPGEEPDQLVEIEGGGRYRVKVQRVAQDVVRPVPNLAAAEVAPTSTTIAISLAELDGDGRVAIDEEGRLRIHDRHEILLLDENAAGFDLAALIDARIEEMARTADRAAAARARALDYLSSEWGL